jgi:YVTN family beta-propeller protein
MGSRFPGFIIACALLVIASTALVPSSTSGTGAVQSPAALPAASVGALATSSNPALGPTPAAAPIEVPVGVSPVAVLVDTTNGTAYVSSQFGNSVTAIDLATNAVVATIPVGSQPYPQALALDLANATVYVANAGSGNVSAIFIPGNYVSSSIAVGLSPDAVAYNPGNKDVYVANAGSGDVTLISSVTNLAIATIPVGPDPDALTVDTTNHYVFVADAGSNNVSVISGITNTVVATVLVGTAPGPWDAMAFDSADNEVFVANFGSNNVSVIGGSNHTLVATIPVGAGPSGLAVDPAKGEVFVANHYSNNVSVISTVTESVVATIPVGSEPAANGAIAINAKLGDLYVPNGGSNNVSVISVASNAVIATVPVLEEPDSIGLNTVNGAVYVADQGAANVSVFELAPVTFHSAGLTGSSTWSVAAGSPAILLTNTTVRGRGTLEFLEPTGVLTYTITSPAGYAVSSVTGPRTPTQTSANVTDAPLSLVVTFGPLETLTFSETGLPASSLWGVAIQTALHSGGPPSQSASTHGTSVAFTVVKGSWKFETTPKPSTYHASPAKGTIGVAAHAATKTIKFAVFTTTVLFEERGLFPNTHWQVNLTGPMNVSLGSTTGTIKFLLVNGTYAFVAWNFSAVHPHPARGSFTVVVPHATLVESVNYTSLPSHFASPLGSALGAPPAAVGALPNLSIGAPGRAND